MTGKSDTEPSQTDGEKLISGLREMVADSMPDDEYHCPNCDQVAEFVHVETVVREEFDAQNDVLGCPTCRFVLVPATQWRSVNGGELD